MTTTLLSESRISLNELAREQGVSLSTAWRWCLRGVRGCVLESISIGGRKYTTVEAYQRWVAITNGEKIPSTTSRQVEARRQKAHEELVVAGMID